jgi:oligoendopeptidase F
MKQSHKNTKRNNNSEHKNQTNSKASNTKADYSYNNAPDKELWNLQPLLDGKPFEQLLKNIEVDVEAFIAVASKAVKSKSAKDVLNALTIKDCLVAKMNTAEGYYELRFYENNKDQETLAMIGRLRQLGTEYSNKMLFFSLWLMKLSRADTDRIIKDNSIKEFRYYIERVRKVAPFTKSEEIEKIINIKDITSGSFSSIYQLITNSYMIDFEGKKLTKEEIVAKFHSEDPASRENAYKAVLGMYGQDSIVLSEIYKNIVLDGYNEDITIRGYKSPISTRNISNSIDDDTVELLLDVVKNNAKVFLEYFRIKHAINSKKKKYPYSRFHIYAPYTGYKEKKFTYDYAKTYVLETYRMFDKRFYDAAKKIFDSKRVHSHPQKDKRGGACCCNITNRQDPYIMLNYTGTMRDMSTMAHELGHGIHDIFSQKQPNLLQHPPLPMCETASIFGEMMLSDRLLKESKDDTEKKAIVLELLDGEYASIVRQAYFVIFEKFAHEKMKDGIMKEELDKKYLSLLKEQFGDMEIDDVFKHEWNYIPHIHESPFYCYAYAWGNLMVLALYEQYRKQGKEFIEKYINLLSIGGSMPPKEALASVGIDITKREFWQSGFDVIKRQVEELKKLEKL